MSTSTLPAPALRIGPLALDAPVVLAPMAGITNTAFRRLCREFGAGLYVSEMITSRALVERTPETMRLITHHESETPRSIQLYGVDPATVAEAVRILVAEDRADHIDLNFGCPVPKVTRKGGGAALPWKLDLFRDIVEGAVRSAGAVPLTIKMRKGIDGDHLTYLEAGRIAEGAGVSSIALHARTAAEFYSGTADWDAIGTLKETVTSVPVLGNGDIWSGADALRMVQQTGCDGVVVGRGCLGRPWLFGDLAAAFAGEDRVAMPSSASWRTRSAATPSSWSSSSAARIAAAATSASTSPGTSRATRSGASCARASRPPDRFRRSTTSSAPSTVTRPTRARPPRGSAAGRAAPSVPCFPRDGSAAARSTSTSGARSRVRNSRTAVAELGDAPGYEERDRERRLPEQHSSRRSDFARDRARLLHSSALRRLAAKTQVLSPTAGLDFARNRLTHSLEVAQVGRELGASLGLNPDVVDTACLAHDIGHPPFGHNGEKALSEWAEDIGGFEGNAQSLRLLTRLEPKAFGPDGTPFGLNLTRASLDASCKYPWSADDSVADPSGRAKFGYYAEDAAAFAWMRDGAPEGSGASKRRSWTSATTSPTRCTTSRTR
ncbi:hypothetical protein GCM10025866_25750 [Naasia aerilata]|uniref:HD domain-containing protein n=1 Tax=Naasia aerilata TaxID=1162966 RepID=A0ABN6XSN6_9MICO|nr:hypothetical protein GCM10025866_25750 [Naasia aerilata]